MKVRTSIFIEDGLWEQFRIEAIRKKKPVSKYLEEIIKRELRK
jgi:hypothetical protein